MHIPREFNFTDQDFQRIRKLIHERAGISLGENKQELVYSRLARRLRATGIKNFADYLDHLQRGDAAEWEAFTNSLTTNLTSFFREPHHFPLLADHLRKQDKGRPLTLWCSACSTGEEAYSMAMTAVEALGGYERPFHIIASDLDTKVLETARAWALQGRCSGQIAGAAGRPFLCARHRRAGRFRAGETRAAEDDRLPAHQPAGHDVADSRAAGCDLLPQCDDLFRQGDATLRSSRNSPRCCAATACCLPGIRRISIMPVPGSSCADIPCTNWLHRTQRR